MAAEKPTRKRTPRVKRTKKAPPTPEQVAFRAYELYVSGAAGDAFAHWLQAERELGVAA
jgi:hypothetical protein